MQFLMGHNGDSLAVTIDLNRLCTATHASIISFKSVKAEQRQKIPSPLRLAAHPTAQTVLDHRDSA